MRKPTQAQQILQYMREHPEGITPITALDQFGCFRLGARIYDLRAEGHQITAETHGTMTGKSVARYRLTGITQTPRTVQGKERAQGVPSHHAAAKLREWVCAQCGTSASYEGASVAGDRYAFGRCYKHGATTVMTLYRDVR